MKTFRNLVIGAVIVGELFAAGVCKGGDAVTVWKMPAGANIAASTETNLPNTADLGWLDLRGLRDTNVFFALTLNGVTDGTSSNLCKVRFAPSVDRIQWATNANEQTAVVPFICTNRVPGTLLDFTATTNGAFFGASPYPFYRVVNVTNMTAKWMSNAVLRAWVRQ
jgi:hypothetical protein